MKFFKYEDFKGTIAGATSGMITAGPKLSRLRDGTLPNHTSVTYYLDGKDIFNTGTEIYEFTKDTIRLSPPHNMYEKEAIAQTVESGSFITVSYISNIPFITETIKVDASSNPKIREMFLEFDSLCKRQKKNYCLLTNSIFFNILYEIFEIFNNANEPRRFKRLTPAVQYIHDHYWEPEFYCGLLPGISGMKYAYFNRLFAEKYNTTPTKYVTALRMEKAADMLVNKIAGIEEVAKATGFTNPSYFSQVFKEYYGVSPSGYKNTISSRHDFNILPHFNDTDRILCSLITYHECLHDINTEKILVQKHIATVISETGDCKNPAISHFKGKLFFAWKCSAGITVKSENIDFTLNDEELDLPALIDDGEGFYLVANKITDGKPSAVLIYKFDEASKQFELAEICESTFRISSGAYRLPSGKLMITGSAYKNTNELPAVLMSDSGKTTGPWRCGFVSKIPTLPDGTKFKTPALSAFLFNDEIFLLCQNSSRNVPLMFCSKAHEEWWSPVRSHNIPVSHAKTCSGSLADGRNYVIGNIYPDSSKLAVFLSEPNSTDFNRALLLRDGKAEIDGKTFSSWHSPQATELDGKLYIIYTATKKDESQIILSEL